MTDLADMVRKIAPYDFEMTEEEVAQVVSAIDARRVAFPRSPHIFDTEARREYADKYLKPLIEHVSCMKTEMRQSRPA